MAQKHEMLTPAEYRGQHIRVFARLAFCKISMNGEEYASAL